MWFKWITHLLSDVVDNDVVEGQESVVRGECVDGVAVGEVAGVADMVGTAVPGLDADKGSIRPGRPQSDVRRVEQQCQPGLTALVHQRDAVYLLSAEYQGVVNKCVGLDGQQ